jgi:hypothetical protein
MVRSGHLCSLILLATIPPSFFPLAFALTTDGLSLGATAFFTLGNEEPLLLDIAQNTALGDLLAKAS